MIRLITVSRTSGHRYSRYQSKGDEQVVSERDAEIAEHVRDCEHKIGIKLVFNREFASESNMI